MLFHEFIKAMIAGKGNRNAAMEILFGKNGDLQTQEAKRVDQTLEMIKILMYHHWKISHVSDRTCTLENKSPAGMTFSVPLTVGNIEEFPTAFCSYADTFDMNEHVMDLLKTDCKLGVCELAQDAMAIKRMLDMVASCFRNIDRNNRKYYALTVRETHEGIVAIKATSEEDAKEIFKKEKDENTAMYKAWKDRMTVCHNSSDIKEYKSADTLAGWLECNPARLENLDCYPIIFI